MDGEIGIRDRLKICWAFARVGSTPTPSMLVTSKNFEKCLRAVSVNTLVNDLETTGLEPHGRDVMCGIGLRPATDGAECYYFPFRHYIGPNLSPSHLQAVLDVIFNAKILIGHNYRFDTQFLLKERPDGEIPYTYCTMLGMFLLDENRKYRGLTYELEKLGEENFGPDATKWQRQLEVILSDHLLTKGDMWRLPSSKVEPYACEDLELTYGLYKLEKDLLEKEKNVSLWGKVSDYSVVVGRMMSRGLRVDINNCQTFIADAERHQLALLQEMQRIAGYKLKPTPKQLGAWLGLPSTAADYLDTIKSDPRVAMVKEFRAYQKAVGSYYKKFLSDSKDGIIHPSFNLVKVVTGRMSAPLLHALPRENEKSAYRVKELLKPRPGFSFIQADYSAAEMRLGSWYAQAQNMTRMLNSGINPHDETSRLIGIPRSAAKAINFSIIYGIGANTLSEDLGISQRKAEDYLFEYNKVHPEFRVLYRRAEHAAKKNGFITMWSGRRRHYTAPNSHTPCHKASDHLIQGGVGELLRERQYRLDKILRQCEVYQLLSVHDSAIMEAPTEEIHRIAPMVREIMEEHTLFNPAMVVDIKIGYNNLSEMVEWRDDGST